jgi:hypothetical protein
MQWPWNRDRTVRAVAPSDGRFRVIEGPVRASAGDEPRGPTPAQLREVRDAVLDRAVADGLVPEDQRDGWERLLVADFAGSFDQLREMAEQRRAGLTAAAPRQPRRDGEAIIAAAASEGRIAESRRDYWLARHRQAPEEVERLMTASPEAGGLVASPVAAASAAASSPAEESEHRAAFAATFAREAAALGYAVPARPARIVDRS